MDGSGLTRGEETLGRKPGEGVPRGRAKPAELVALVLALEERSGLDAQERQRIDREIGTRLARDERAGNAFRLLRAWLEVAPSEGLKVRIARVDHSLALLGWLFLGLGSFFGWAAASALLSIEVHAGRINIVLCLALLVFLPLLMLLASALGGLLSLRGVALFRRHGGPGGGASESRAGRRWFGDGWRRAGIGRLAMRLVPPSIRPDVEVVLGRLSAHARLYARVQRGQLLAWSQVMGLGFGLGALVATLAFVVFTDLAFGWSTTLEVEAAQLHGVLRLLALPWASLWPDADPSLGLVEATRYFRVSAEDHIHVVDPILYGGWWPFLVMSIAFYVVLPRAFALFCVSRFLGRETGRAMGLTPGVERLLARLTTPLVETTAEGEEGEVGHAESGLVPEVEAAVWLTEQGGEAPIVVRWAELSSEAALREALGADIQLRDAGGGRSLAEDSAVVREAGVAAGGVALCVRGFEPPVLEILDFLRELRAEIGDVRPMCVILVGGRAPDRETWRRKLLGLGDVRLSVARAPIAEDESDA